MDQNNFEYGHFSRSVRRMQKSQVSSYTVYKQLDNSVYISKKLLIQ